ncbi:MAG: response regulator, partial [Elusimicrobiota bacterium]
VIYLKKIMVVDDDTDQIYTINQILNGSDEEYEVIGATGGKECLDLLNQNKVPDLILLDIMMPDMSGWDLVKKLKKTPWKDIPVVFLSARTNKIAKSAGCFYGVDYIEKPFDIEDLKRRIDRILENFG